MKKFSYPLERLKQVRELELADAADTLRHIRSEIQKLNEDISHKKTAILTSQKLLLETEAKSGTVRPDLRKMTALYIHSIQMELEKLHAAVLEFEEQEKQAHAHLIEKKQSVKMLENHKERLQSHHQSNLQILQQKEDDELWLTRQKTS